MVNDKSTCIDRGKRGGERGSEFLPGSRVRYNGSNSPVVLTGEVCVVVREIPHGTYMDAEQRILEPQPRGFDPKLGRYIGDWLEVQTDEGEVFRMPCSWFTAMAVMRKAIADTRLNRQMAEGHLARKGHVMVAHLESSDGEVWSTVYDCCLAAQSGTGVSHG